MDYARFSPMQLRQVMGKWVIDLSNAAYGKIPQVVAPGEAHQWAGVQYSVGNPAAAFVKGSSSYIKYGEHPNRAGFEGDTPITLSADRLPTDYRPLPIGESDDPHRIEALENYAQVCANEWGQRANRETVGKIFDPTGKAIFSITGGVGNLDELATFDDAVQALRRELNTRKFYIYKAVTGASLEGWVSRGSLLAFRKLLEVTGILGRETAGATTRLNPGFRGTDEQLVDLLAAELMMDKIHIEDIPVVSQAFDRLPGDQVLSLVDQTAGSMVIALQDRQASTYDMRYGIEGLYPRFGFVTVGNSSGFTPRLLNDVDAKGQAESLWCEKNFNVVDVTEQLRVKYSDFPQPLVVTDIAGVPTV